MKNRGVPKVLAVSTAKRTKARWLFIALILSPLTLAYHCGGGGGGEEPSTSVSGRVTMSDGRGVSGILVHAFAAPLDASPGCGEVRQATTDANGFYRITETGSGLDAVNVSIGPVGNNVYRFDPPGRTFTINYGEHLTGYDFLATQLHSISGRIGTSDGTGVPSVTVSLADGISSFATTSSDASGSYVFSDITAGSYTITPTGFMFLPVSRTVTVVDGTPPSDPSGQDFVLGEVFPPGG